MTDLPPFTLVAVHRMVASFNHFGVDVALTGAIYVVIDGGLNEVIILLSLGER